MQSSLLIEYPAGTSADGAAKKPMNLPPVAQRRAPTSAAAALALRLAQRAFPAVIEDAARTRTGQGTFGTAQLRSAGHRTLSALSADDRSRFNRWLILQFAAGGAPDSALVRRWRTRVDARLGASVSTTVAPARAQWRDASNPGAAA